MKTSTTLISLSILATLGLGTLVAAQPERKPKVTPPIAPVSPITPDGKPVAPSEPPAAPKPEKPGDVFPPGMPGMPGLSPQHEMLKQFDGKWNGKVEIFAPGQGGEPMQGTMTCTLVLGGRFAQQAWKGNFMGLPFEGLGFLGYDTGKKKWVSNWMDTMVTGIAVSEGDYDAAKKSWTLVGKMTGPTGAEKTSKEVTSFSDKDNFVTEVFSIEGGKETREMKITYTRAK